MYNNLSYTQYGTDAGIYAQLYLREVISVAAWYTCPATLQESGGEDE